MEQQPTQTTHPTKQAVRELMQRRRSEHTPPPPAERGRQGLGWWLIPETRSAT